MATNVIDLQIPGPRLRRFSDYTADNARQVLARAKNEWEKLGAEANRLFYRGDHFQGGTQWRGPRPQLSSGVGRYAAVWAEIMDGFVSKNAIAEVVDRHTFGVMGREPMWSFAVKRALKKDEKPSAEEQRRIDEATAAMVEAWDAHSDLLTWQEATRNCLLESRGPLRLFIPPRADAPLTLADACRSVFLQALEPDQATVYRDSLSMQTIGVYEYTDPADDGGDTFVEVTFLDERGRTVLRTLKNEGVANRLASFVGLARARAVSATDLGGRLFMYEMSRRELIDEQVRQNQCLLNMALTMLPRNVVLGGFLERVYLNAQRPTEKKLKSDGSGEYEEVETTLKTGPGATTYATGVTYTDEQGNTRVANPSVVFRDPVKVETFEDTARIAHENILDSTHQKHVKQVGNAEIGAESLKQARDDYEKSLKLTKLQLDAAGRWYLETKLRAAAILSGTPGRYDDLRASFDARIDVGIFNSEERRMMQDEVKNELMSRQTYMNLTGRDDPDAEIAMIDADMSLSAQQLRLQIAQQAQGLGAEDSRVKRLAGIPEGEQLTRPQAVKAEGVDLEG